jgi:multiple sugar transport system permease protein/raffinose/stachyose/melibiose transport system permease protein/trehalose/maltose transport system permease protein
VKAHVRPARLFTVIAGVALVFGVLFPLYWGLRTSLTSGSGASLLPQHPTLDNFRYIFAHSNFGNTVLNSMIVSIGAVVIAVPTAALAAYALARLTFPGKRLGAMLLVLPLLPAVAVLVPLIVYARALGVYNTLYAVILGAAGFALPFAIWMIRGFIMSVPTAVEEAALVDGAGRLGVLIRIVLPLVTPGLIAATVFVFITAWNNYLLAAAFTTTEQLQVVPIAIVGYTSTWGTNYGGMNAAAIVAIAPPLLLFFAVQRWFVQGLLAGADR